MGELELERLRRQLRLALQSNAKLRAEIVEQRERYRGMLRDQRQGKYEQKERAELWKHRALVLSEDLLKPRSQG